MFQTIDDRETGLTRLSKASLPSYFRKLDTSPLYLAFEKEPLANRQRKNSPEG